MSVYDAKRVGRNMLRRRFQRRPDSKPAVDGVLFGVVQTFLAGGLSPGQNATTLKLRWPDSFIRTDSADTIKPALTAYRRVLYASH